MNIFAWRLTPYQTYQLSPPSPNVNCHGRPLIFKYLNIYVLCMFNILIRSTTFTYPKRFELGNKTFSCCADSRVSKQQARSWPFYKYFQPFFANYNSSFHKTEVLTVILKGLICQNLNWTLIQHKPQFLSFPFIFNFVRKKMEI